MPMRTVPPSFGVPCAMRRRRQAGHAVGDRRGDAEQRRDAQEIAAVQLSVCKFAPCPLDDRMKFVGHRFLPRCSLQVLVAGVGGQPRTEPPVRIHINSALASRIKADPCPQAAESSPVCARARTRKADQSERLACERASSRSPIPRRTRRNGRGKSAGGHVAPVRWRNCPASRRCCARRPLALPK